MTESSLPDILRQIVARRRERLGPSTDDPARPAAGERAPLRDVTSSPFLAALAARRGRAVIAEVKMGSPRLGDLSGRVDPLAQSRAYAAGGAAALSVVVEPDFFHGSYELLSACREASGLPTIAKDFVFDWRQLEWARAAGADAVLLLAALFDAPTLRAFADAARWLGLVPLVETHDLADVERLAGAEWELVGVNNRDLRTFAVDLEQSRALAPRLPPRALLVAESGIRSATEIAQLREVGFDAFLIGESLLLAPDPAAALASLLA